MHLHLLVKVNIHFKNDFSIDRHNLAKKEFGLE